MSIHDDYWHKVAAEAANRIERIFEESGIPLERVIGDGNGIDHYDDAVKALAYVLCHDATSREKACAILSACEWVQACRELHEHSAVATGVVA